MILFVVCFPYRSKPDEILVFHWVMILTMYIPRNNI